MPMLNKPTNAVAALIPLDRIKESDNVRVTYDAGEIDALAASIEQHGQLQPVGVKPADGEGNYELVFGHRRHRAFERLVKDGKPFTQVKAVFVTGNTLTLQLVENVQRSDLSPEEKELALQEMAKSMSQVEIARALNKSAQWVSNLFAGIKVREVAAEGNVDTAGMGTRVLAAVRSVPQKDLSKIIDETKKNGGTVAAAKKAVQEYQAGKEGKKLPPAVVEMPLKENPEDGYDFGRRVPVELGEVIAEIANYRYGFSNIAQSSKTSNVVHTCNKIIEKLITKFGAKHE